MQKDGWKTWHSGQTYHQYRKRSRWRGTETFGEGWSELPSKLIWRGRTRKVKEGNVIAHVKVELAVQCESNKSSLSFSYSFFPNGWEFLVQI